jgi:Holliday junction resolvasome RuvABC endonuclease subunit
MALDVSTTTIGIAIIDYDDGYDVRSLQTGWYRPNYTKQKWHELDPATHLILIDAAQHEIMHWAQRNKIDEFVIEDYVQYLGGGSTAKTIIPLAVLNMSLRLMIWKMFAIEPVPYSVMKVRHTIKTGKTLPAKEEIPKLVDKLLGKGMGHGWEYKTNRRTKKKELTQESYDVADAIAVGLAHIKIKSSPPKKKGLKKRAKR